MQDVVPNIAIVIAAGVAAAALLTWGVPPREGTPTALADQTAMVVSIARRQNEPAAKSTDEPRIASVRAPSADPGSLARQLQAELKRVGCYDDQINGVWTASSRRAMQSFTDLVNAKLPVDKPDPILLALVQGHRERVCTGSNATLSKPQAADAQPLPTANPPSAAQLPPAPVVAVAPKLISPPTEVIRAAAPSTPGQASPAARNDSLPLAGPPPVPEPAARGGRPDRPQRAAPHDAPRPSAGVYERRVRQSSRRTPYLQIAYARSLFRGFKRAVTTALPLP